MNAPFCTPMTVDEYLTLAARQQETGRSELINGQAVAMSPEQSAHRQLKARIFRALAESRARMAAPCIVEPDGATVRIDDYTAYEPDALVYPGDRLPPDSLEVPAPVVVVEVISPTTRHLDTSAKLIGYFKVPSVQHYLIADPDTPTLIHYQRTPTVGLRRSRERAARSACQRPDCRSTSTRYFVMQIDRLSRCRIGHP